MIILLSVILCGCIQEQSFTNKDFVSNHWFDEFGNEYKFTDNKLEVKYYLNSNWWRVGSYIIKNNTFILKCDGDAVNERSGRIHSANEDKIVLSNPLEICFLTQSQENKNLDFVLWKDISHFVDIEERISAIEIIVKPQSFHTGFRRLNLSSGKKVELAYNIEGVIDTTYLLDDSIYQNIEELIQILPIENYVENYHYGITDGVDFEIELNTNRVSKRIFGYGDLPYGLDNLYGYIKSGVE